LTKNTNFKKSEKKNEEKRMKKRKPSKPRSSVKRKANVKEVNNRLKRRKVDVLSTTAKGRCRVDSDVNDRNTLRKPLRKSTRLSTITTYNKSSSEDEEMEVNNDLLPVSVDNQETIAKGKSTTLSTVVRYNKSSSEDEDMEISDNFVPASVHKECLFKPCVVSTVSNRCHMVHKNASFDEFIKRVEKEKVHDIRDEVDVHFKVHIKGCKCGVMSNYLKMVLFE
jgi:hypothetical protein